MIDFPITNRVGAVYDGGEGSASPVMTCPAVEPLYDGGESSSMCLDPMLCRELRCIYGTWAGRLAMIDHWALCQLTFSHGPSSLASRSMKFPVDILDYTFSFQIWNLSSHA